MRVCLREEVETCSYVKWLESIARYKIMLNNLKVISNRGHMSVSCKTEQDSVLLVLRDSVCQHAVHSTIAHDQPLSVGQQERSRNGAQK